VDHFFSCANDTATTESWILVNTAVREGLPNAFLEAAAHGCASLSAVDPDGFASRFGAKVEGDDFTAGLETLLQGDRWRGCGERAREHVRSTFELATAIDRHLAIYNELLAGESSPAGSVH